LIDGVYHSYQSFMCRHQTLGAWTTASSSAHLVSPSPVGPFEWSPAECDANGICTPQLYPGHITRSSRQIIPGNPLSFSFTMLVMASRPRRIGILAITSPTSHRHTLPWATPSATNPPVTRAPRHTSSTRTIPTDPGFGPSTTRARSSTLRDPGADTMAGNPAALMEPDGSVKLYFTSRPCPPNSGAKAPNCIAMATAPSWDAVYQMNAVARPITFPESEDPSVFKDPRGNYHLLTNVNTYHARCAQGVPCGGTRGHATVCYSLTSRLALSAPSSRSRMALSGRMPTLNGRCVTTGADGTPLALYVGMGRSSYEDSCNWAQLFCTAGAVGCGPTFPSPPPPPPPPRRIVNGGLCLGYNVSDFPCSGTGPAAGCPVIMQDCASNGTLWTVTPNAKSPISTSGNDGLALDVDCNNAVPNTIVKVLASGPSPLTFNTSAGIIEFEGGMCLNAGQGQANKPCGPHGEVYVADQIKLVSCTDGAALGWSLE